MLPSPGTTLIKVRWLGLENLNGRYVEPERTIDVAGQSTHRDGFLGFSSKGTCWRKFPFLDHPISLQLIYSLSTHCKCFGHVLP